MEQIRSGVVWQEEGVRDLGPGQEAFVLYVIDHIWSVRMAAQTHLPWDGPESVSISFTTGAATAVEDVELAQVVNGVNTDVVQRLPFADARKRLRRLRAQARLSGDPRVDALGTRFKSSRQWAEFAALYADAAALGQSPIAALAAVSGLDRQKLADRARQARQKGLLTKPTPHHKFGVLTKRAQRLLEEGESE